MTALRDPYWSDGQATIYHGDARQVLAEMPAGSVDCIVTSPPYWGLRHYCDGQYGQEPTIQAYVETLRSTFAEARRVLTDDGTCWLNLGDVYAANSDGCARGAAFNRRQPLVRPRARQSVPPKNLLGMPWRVAFALQEDGWILRNAIVWHKPNAMPQSIRDRLTNRYELIFLLVKQQALWIRPGSHPRAVHGRPPAHQEGTLRRQQAEQHHHCLAADRQVWHDRPGRGRSPTRRGNVPHGQAACRRPSGRQEPRRRLVDPHSPATGGPLRGVPD
ncbi:DNA-methyltransferase [Nonomuraea angiospora]|uniref:Methyltransferase n=1 Tax=Nonomuraea angiospora TaxID=46172 RepID=A0ABR9LW66_9ACTN|nr:hypothetical protein [Nonomuraea angiospora]